MRRSTGSSWASTTELTELFETARARGETDGVSYTIAVEMREIYNEQIRDLLRRTDKDATWNGVTEQPRFHERRPTTSSEGTDDSDVEVTRVTARDARARARDNGRGNREEGPAARLR